MSLQSYRIRSIRLSEETWRKLKEKRWKSKVGWEKFILNLIKNEQKFKSK